MEMKFKVLEDGKYELYCYYGPSSYNTLTTPDINDIKKTIDSFLKIFDPPKPMPKEYSNHETCISCGIQNDSVEVGGIIYCPNPICTVSGAVWFRHELKSYKDEGMFSSTHTVDTNQWFEEAVIKILEINQPKMFNAGINVLKEQWIPRKLLSQETIELAIATFEDELKKVKQ